MSQPTAQRREPLLIGSALLILACIGPMNLSRAEGALKHVDEHDRRECRHAAPTTSRHECHRFDELWTNIDKWTNIYI